MRLLSTLGELFSCCTRSELSSYSWGQAISWTWDPSSAARGNGVEPSRRSDAFSTHRKCVHSETGEIWVHLELLSHCSLGKEAQTLLNDRSLSPMVHPFFILSIPSFGKYWLQVCDISDTVLDVRVTAENIIDHNLCSEDACIEMAGKGSRK